MGWGETGRRVVFSSWMRWIARSLNCVCGMWFLTVTTCNFATMYQTWRVQVPSFGMFFNTCSNQVNQKLCQGLWIAKAPDVLDCHLSQHCYVSRLLILFQTCRALHGRHWCTPQALLQRFRKIPAQENWESHSLNKSETLIREPKSLNKPGLPLLTFAYFITNSSDSSLERYP